jgi:RNA polymerase sigma factor (TIGR02999 family)
MHALQLHARAQRPPTSRSMSTTVPDSTQLLLKARTGDRAAFDRLFAQVYEELRRIAHQRLQRHRPGETLNTTGLVHEVYLRLIDRTRLELHDREHFLALASRAMRFILVNHAEARAAQKRGSGRAPIPLERVQVAAEGQSMDLLALHQALERLGGYDARLGQLVELRFFGGLTYDEIAEVRGVSVPTVRRDWTRAKGWLYRFMESA